MATIGNNVSSEYANVRDAFFTPGEIENFEKIMKDPENFKFHNKLIKQNVHVMYAKAMDLIERVERGEFNENQMERVERLIAHCLASIEDLHLELVHEKYYDDEQCNVGYAKPSKYMNQKEDDDMQM